MNCPKCGNQLSPNMKFCAKCGSPAPQQPVKPMQYSNTVPQKPMQPQQPAQPKNMYQQQIQTRPATPVLPQQTVQPDPKIQQSAPGPKKKKTSKKSLALKIIAIILAVAVLVTGGVFATDAILFKVEADKGDYITDFPILKQKTEFHVYDAEKFPYEEYNIKVDRFTTGRVFKSSSFNGFENVINEKSDNPIFNIDFEKDGRYQITLEGIVSSRTQAVPVTGEPETQVDNKEPIVIVIIVIVDDDHKDAVDKVDLNSTKDDKTDTKSGPKKEISLVSKISKYDKNAELSGYTLYSYNDLGLIEEEKSYGADGELVSGVSYKYNEKGLLILQKFIDPTGIFDLEMRYEYDESGKIKRFALCDDEGVETSQIYDSYGMYVIEGEYEYDSNQNIVKSTILNDDGKPEFIYEYEYNSANRCIKETEHYYPEEYYENPAEKNGYIMSVYTYNDKGKYIEVVTSDSYRKYIYNADGSVTKKTSYSKLVYTYDVNGNVVEKMRWYSDDGVNYYEGTRWTTEYDENGNVLSALQHYYDDINNDSEYLAEYDENGRMIRFIEKYYADAGNVEVKQQVIEYDEVSIYESASMDKVESGQKEITSDLLPGIFYNALG